MGTIQRGGDKDRYFFFRLRGWDVKRSQEDRLTDIFHCLTPSPKQNAARNRFNRAG